MGSSDTLAVHMVTGHQLFDEFTRRLAFIERTFEQVENVEHADRRSVKRHEPEAGSVEVSVAYSDGSEAPALLADLSTHGAELLADRLPSRDEVVRLTFDLGDRRLTLDGVVRHSGNDDALRYFGVQFVDSPVGEGTGPAYTDASA